MHVSSVKLVIPWLHENHKEVIPISKTGTKIKQDGIFKLTLFSCFKEANPSNIRSEYKYSKSKETIILMHWPSTWNEF